MNKNKIIYLLLATLTSVGLWSCNDDNKITNEDEVIYGTSMSSTLVTSFSLVSNDKVLAHLDSVKFTIDQDNAIIYNPDSLPMGTDVSKIVTKVEFGSSVYSATYLVRGGKLQSNDSIPYHDAAKDTVDFTGIVNLKVVAQNGINQNTYRVKINVHQTNPDSIHFAESSRRGLPSDGGTPDAMGMANKGGTFYCLTHAGNYTMSTASTPAGQWNTVTANLPFTPVPESMTATEDALYVLADNGGLYKSEDGNSWEATGATWSALIGAYGNCLLGIANTTDGYVFDEYPQRATFKPTAVPTDFPVSGFSQMVVSTNDWAINDMGTIAGGRLANGTLTNDIWGYDGQSWAKLNYNTSDLPAIEGATLFGYYVYETNSTNLVVTRKPVWVLMGGRLSNGTLNRTTYITKNQGIRWTKAGSSMNIPSYMPSFTGAKAFVCTETFKAARQRINKHLTEWDSPYVYIAGGHDVQGYQLNSVWKGIINRMLSKPLY